jgi:hypothetical protein
MKAVRHPPAPAHRHTAPGQHEHDFEPQYGLPEVLPEGETLLWQGSPDWKALAVRRFHLRKLGLYFAVLLVARLASLASDGADLLGMLRGSAVMFSLSALCMGLFALMAWLTARTTVYTLTSRRVVMRIGVVLTLSLNLPLRLIEGADLGLHTGTVGDVALRLLGKDRIAYFQLWPHARPWRFSQPEPTLLCLADAPMLAERLTEAWRAVNGDAARASSSAEARPPSSLSRQLAPH